MTTGTELEIPSGERRDTPWGRIGVSTNGAMTAKEALKIGGLDWTVEKKPLTYHEPLDDGQNEFNSPGLLVPNRFALIRSSDLRVMTIVSDVYKPFQNHQAFDFMDNLVDSGDGKYDTVGSNRHGAVVFLSMKIPMDLQIAGEDAHDVYLLLRTTHDGSGRVGAYVTVVRTQCTNMLTYATHKASHSWGFTHTADVAGKMQEARESLKLTFKYTEAYKEIGDMLSEIKVTDDEAVSLLEGIVPARSKRDEEIEGIMSTFRGSPNLGNFRNTGWGFVNAYSEFQEHIRPSQSGEALFGKTLDGPQAKARTELTRRLLARA